MSPTPINDKKIDQKSKPFVSDLEKKIDYYHYDATRKASKDKVLKKRFQEQAYRPNSFEASDNSHESSDEKEDHEDMPDNPYQFAMNMGESTVFAGRIPQQ